METFREASSNVALLNKHFLFDCLRKPEYLSIIQAAFGEPPAVPGTRIHAACKQLFTTLSNEQAHFHFTSVLKQRQFSKEQIQLVNKVDKVLKCLLAEKRSVMKTTLLPTIVQVNWNVPEKFELWDCREACP